MLDFMLTSFKAHNHLQKPGSGRQLILIFIGVYDKNKIWDTCAALKDVSFVSEQVVLCVWIAEHAVLPSVLASNCIHDSELKK